MMDAAMTKTECKSNRQVQELVKLSELLLALQNKNKQLVAENMRLRLENAQSKNEKTKVLKKSTFSPILRLVHLIKSMSTKHKAVLYRKKKIKDSPEYQAIDASFLFDSEWYYENYPDVAFAQADPIEHYLNYGEAEGRNPGPLFNSVEYIKNHPKENFTKNSALYHYLSKLARND